MQRIDPEGLLLQAMAGKEELMAEPDLSQIFMAGKICRPFVYRKDSTGRWWGSFRKPALLLGEVEFLQVLSVNRTGAFLDWNLEKPLFCPFSRIIGSPRTGMLVPVRLLEDDRAEGLIASMQWKLDVRAAGDDYEKGREVDILVMESHELGYLVLADHVYQGMVYANQVFQPLRPGQRMKAWVNFLRPDGKLDLLLRRPGYREVPDSAQELLKKIREAGGRLPLGDKTPADEIYRQLGMSKKVFKQALGFLYRQGQVVPSDFQVLFLNQEGD